MGGVGLEKEIVKRSRNRRPREKLAKRSKIGENKAPKVATPESDELNRDDLALASMGGWTRQGEDFDFNVFDSGF